MNVHVRRRLHAGIEPEARRNTTTPIWAFELGLVMVAVLDCFTSFDEADALEWGADHLWAAFFDPVHHAHFERIQSALVGELIKDSLACERGIARTRGPICLRLGPIHYHVLRID